jgi:hypothetical protein
MYNNDKVLSSGNYLMQSTIKTRVVSVFTLFSCFQQTKKEEEPEAARKAMESNSKLWPLHTLEQLAS